MRSQCGTQLLNRHSVNVLPMHRAVAHCLCLQLATIQDSVKPADASTLVHLAPSVSRVMAGGMSQANQAQDRFCA